MRFVPQRFIHAANVRLDVPVSVHLTEQLTDELRHALEDATLTAFDSVVANCIAQKVDFLLLSGNVFVESDRSLRARLKLIDGCRSLKKQGIGVFVLPGDLDPPEAWRSIPELPSNVTVCYSSNPEPSVLERQGRVITTVTASMWYGETDAFGIQVIGRAGDGAEPFRIGVVSQAKFDESLRMASLTTSESDELLRIATSTDEEESSPLPASAGAVDNEYETVEDYEAAFHSYIEQAMLDGRLDYVALAGELDRSTLNLDGGRVHCPGTTQPRNQLEADCGLCSLVEVDSEARVSITEINTSAVDWKTIELEVSAGLELNTLLQQMRNCLFEESVSPSDRIWSVRWTLAGPLPVIQEFLEEDLELAMAVELEELQFDDHVIRLVHDVRMLPDAWELSDPQALGQQFATTLLDEKLDRARFTELVDSDDRLTDAWSHRLKAMVRGLDRERILGQLRTDGAEWFVSDLSELLPQESDVMTMVESDEEAECETESEFESDDSEEDAETLDADTDYSEDQVESDEDEETGN
jgi:DNA repair exonuclease SbcCD nuclease subunit